LRRGRGADAARGGNRTAGHQADPDLHLVDGVGDVGTGTGHRMAVRDGGPAGRSVVPGDGPSAVQRRSARRVGETPAVVPAVEQLSGRGFLRARGRLRARTADTVLTFSISNIRLR